MRCQSVASGVRARAWQAAIAACSWYGPMLAVELLGARQRGQAAADQQRVPAPRSCAISRTGSPSGATRARMREAWISISATRPCTSGVSRRQLRQDAPEAQRLVAQRGPRPVVAGGGRVALVEDQVDHLEHRRPGDVRARRRAGPRTGPARRPACAWRGRCAARSSASGCRKARAISSRAQAGQQLQRERHPGVARQHRMAGGEDEAQQVVADVVGVVQRSR